MTVFALLVAIGLKLYGIVDISWASLVLFFIFWLERGKDWTNIDSAIRGANARVDEVSEKLNENSEKIKVQLDKVFKKIAGIERPEKLFKRIEDKVLSEDGLINLTEEEDYFLYNETKDINRKNSILKIDTKNRNKNILEKRYSSFLRTCEFKTEQIRDIIKKGTILLRMTDEEFVIKIITNNVTDDIEDLLYKEVMEAYDRKVDFKIEGDIYDNSKKNKYREDYLLEKRKYRDELVLKLKGEKDINKLWDTFLVYMARASLVIEDELKSKVFLDKVVKHYWHISAFSDTLPNYIDVRKEFSDFFGEHVTIIFIEKEDSYINQT